MFRSPLAARALCLTRGPRGFRGVKTLSYDWAVSQLRCRKGRFAGPSQLAAVEPCKVDFWTFAGSVVVGSAAATAVSWLTSKAWDENTTAKKTAAAFIKMGTFWIAGGLAWVALSRKYVSIPD